jgi:hypothetical protein
MLRLERYLFYAKTFLINNLVPATGTIGRIITADPAGEGKVRGWLHGREEKAQED